MEGHVEAKGDRTEASPFDQLVAALNNDKIVGTDSDIEPLTSDGLERLIANDAKLERYIQTAFTLVGGAPIPALDVANLALKAITSLKKRSGQAPGQGASASGAGAGAGVGAGAGAAAQGFVVANPWTASSEATSYIRDLLACTPEELPIHSGASQAEGGSSVLVYKLAQPLQLDERKNTSNLVVAPNAQRLWTTLLAKQRHDAIQSWVIIGSPGLGKSRSAWYFVRLFVDARRRQVAQGVPMPIVVVEHRKDSLVWKFVPVGAHDAATEYRGWECPLPDFADIRERCLRQPHNLFIVDAAKAEGRSDDPSLLQATTILVCSPDPLHYSEFSKSASKRYMGPGCADALVAAAPYMNKPGNHIAEEVVRARVAKVGPFPRRVFSSERFGESCGLIDAAFSNSRNLCLVEDVLRTGLSKHESNVKADIKPLSTVFMLQATPDCQGAQPVFVSDYARGRVGYDLAVRVYSALLSRNRDLGGVAELGTTMEFLTFRLMQSGRWRPKLLPHDPGQNPVTISIGGAGGDVVLTPPPWKPVYASIAELPPWKRQATPMAAPLFLASNFPVVDAMDARNRGFQITLAQRKQWDEETVRLLRHNLGLRGTALLHIIVVHLEGQSTGLPRRAPKHTRLYSVALPSPRDAPDMWNAVLGSGTGAGTGAGAGTGDDAVGEHK